MTAASHGRSGQGTDPAETTDWRLATLAAESEALGRDVSEIRQSIQAMDVRSRDDSGRLTRVETALGALGESVRDLTSATREQTAQLRGGIDRAISAADDAARRSVRNAERIDEHGALLATHAAQLAVIEKAEADRKVRASERRRWWGWVVAAVVFAGTVGGAVKTWLDIRARAVGSQEAAGDGVGDNDRPDVVGW